MANSYSYQTLEDTRKVIVKLTGQLDGSEENNPFKIKANTFSGALNTDGDYLSSGGSSKSFYETTVNKIWYSTSNTSVELFWSGNTASSICFINNNNEYNKMNNWLTINNNAEIPTGDIGIKTYNSKPNSHYTIILELHKNNRDYDAGWMNDPNAFNYTYYTFTDEDGNTFYAENDDTLLINQ
jgi:hypothetical protein